MNTLLAHLIIGLAGIGAFSALAATGTIDGTTAVTGIGGITGVLLGTSSQQLGAAVTAKSTLSSQPAAAIKSTPVAGL